ncbi:MAG: glycosyltransferase [Phycisphaerales bacterium]
MSTPGESIRAVLLGYYFPPMGGAGTQRLASFARDLPALGIEPVVVAASETVPGDSTLAHDVTLLDGIDPSVSIIRVPGIAEQTPTGRDRRTAHRLVASAVDLAWARRAVDAAVFASRRHAADVTLVSVSPYTLGLHVGELRRRTRRPVVIDLRDPWALDGWRSFRSRIQVRADRWFMARSLAAADAIIANCPAAAAAYRALPGVRPDRVVVVPNGWSATDYADQPGRAPVAPTDRSTFRIAHIGTLHDPTPPATRHPRPHTCAPLEYRHRSGRTLLTAIGHIMARRPDLRHRLQLDLFGSVHPGHADLVRQLRLSDVVHEHGYVSHPDAIAAAKKADALFVPLHGVPHGDPALIVPGKLYEALASERPVLAAVPVGDARRLVLLAGGDGAVVDPGDADAAADRLETWINRWSAGQAPSGARRSALIPFERTSLSSRVAEILRAAHAGNPSAFPADDPWSVLAAQLQDDADASVSVVVSQAA